MRDVVTEYHSATAPGVSKTQEVTRPFAAVSAILALLPCAFVLWAVLSYGYGYPVWEEWVFIHDWDQFLNHGSWVHSIFQPAFGHQLAIWRLLLIVVGSFTKFASTPRLLLSWLFVFVSCCLYSVWLRRMQPAMLLLLPVVAFLTFSLRGGEIFFDGGGDAMIPFLFVEVQLMLLFLTAQRLTWPKLATAALMGLFASFTWGAGPFALGVGTLILALRVPFPKLKLVIWIFATLSIWAVFRAYSQLVPSAFIPLSLGGIFTDSARLISSPLLSTTSVWPGIIIVSPILLLVLLRKSIELRKLRHLTVLPWLGMLLFAGATVLVILGKIVLTRGDPTQSRYTFITAQFIFCVIAVAVTLLTGRPGASRSRFFLSLIAVMCLGGLVAVWARANYQFLNTMQSWQPGLLKARIIAKYAPFCLTPELLLGSGSSDLTLLAGGLDIMRRDHIDLFRSRADVLPAGTPCPFSNEKEEHSSREVFASESPAPNGAHILTLTYHADDGSDHISWAQAAINSSLDSTRACYFSYEANSDSVFLVDDGGTSWLGPVKIGGPGRVSNGQCAIDSRASSLARTPDSLILRLAVSWKPDFGRVDRRKTVYMQMGDIQRQASGWRERGELQ